MKEQATPNYIIRQNLDLRELRQHYVKSFTSRCKCLLIGAAAGTMVRLGVQSLLR